MKQVEYQGNGRFSVAPEAPVPTPDDDEVVVKVRYCGVCGSDLHIFQTSGHAQNGTVLGHEISGQVEDVGKGITDLKPGDRVTALCSGGYAQYTKTTRDHVIPLPESMSYQQAALSAGPIGLFTMQAALLAGALEVFVTEPAPGRAKAAEGLGAAAVFDPTSQDAAAELAKLAPDGLDVVFDCAGATGTLDLALEMVKKGGTVTVVGLSGHDDIFNTRSLFRTHARLQAVPGAFEVWPLSVKLIAKGRVDPAKIVTDIVPLEDLPRFLQDLHQPQDQVQVLVDPWGEAY